MPNPYLEKLIDPSFQRVNRIFVLWFENITDRTVHTKFCLLTVEIKDYKVMINGENFFDQPANKSSRTYDNIQKIATFQGDDYISSCLLDYSCVNEY